MAHKRNKFKILSRRHPEKRPVEMFRLRKRDNIKLDVSLIVKSELFLSVLGREQVVGCCAEGDDVLCPVIENDFLGNSLDQGVL